MSDEIAEIEEIDTSDGFAKALREFRERYMKTLKRAMVLSFITTAFFGVMMVIYFSTCFSFGCSVSLTDIVLFSGGLAVVALVNSVRVRVDADSKFSLLTLHISQYTLDKVNEFSKERKPRGRPKKAK